MPPDLEEGLRSLNSELDTLGHMLPGKRVSATRVQAVAKVILANAGGSRALLERSVKAVERFVSASRPHCRLGGLYVTDAVCRSERQKSRTAATREFEAVVDVMVAQMKDTSEDDRKSAARLLGEWQKHDYFPSKRQQLRHLAATVLADQRDAPREQPPPEPQQEQQQQPQQRRPIIVVGDPDSVTPYKDVGGYAPPPPQQQQQQAHYGYYSRGGGDEDASGKHQQYGGGGGGPPSGPMKSVMAKPPANPALLKTRMCRSVESGLTCRFGDQCTFAHSAAELRRPSPPINNNMNNNNNASNDSNKVPTANGTANALPPALQRQQDSVIWQSHLKKTKLCRHFLMGSCPFGDKCNFAHGEEEMRSVNPNEEKQPPSPGPPPPPVSIYDPPQQQDSSSSGFAALPAKTVGGGPFAVPDYASLPAPDLRRDFDEWSEGSLEPEPWNTSEVIAVKRPRLAIV